MKLAKDTTISHYRILSKIDKGGMGEVYLAQDTTLDRKVAVKMLTHECCDDSERLQRFVQEAKTASALNHPNIITIFQFGSHEDTHFLACEYIEGRELGDLLADKLPLESVLEISVQVVSALKTAHDAGIIHRDIKPNNIMVRNDGIIKVLDFGLAKLTNLSRKNRVDDQAATVAKLDTIPGLVMGTPNYMSPEQARGKDIDHLTDIFSFGVVLYEMLTRIRPFEGETVSDVIAAVITKDPVPLREIDRNLPPELELIIARALRKEKRDRYQTADELLTDLSELRQDLQVRDRLVRSDKTNSSILNAGNNHSPGSAPAESKSTIAVLPFRNMSVDNGNDYFSEGLTEEIIMNLSKLNSLRVVASGSTIHYIDEGKTHKQTADDLGVQYLLEGSVRRQGNDLRITAQLVDTKHQAYLWSETYRGTIKDIFEIQEKVATEIVRALEVRLSPDEQQNLKKRFTENTEAYQLYLQGRFFWNKRSEEGLKTAIRYFEEAIEKDPKYALAWAGIADSYSLLGEYGTIPRKELYPKAEAAVEKALEFDDRLAEVHTSLASLLMLNKWDWENSKREFELALELNPNYATAHHWYSHWFLNMGDLDKSIRMISRAAELDPVSQAIIKDKGIALYYNRQFDSAIELALKTLELDPLYPAAHRLLSLSYQGTGRFDEAIAENAKWGKLTGNRLETKFGLAQLYAVSGKRQEAKDLVRDIENNKSMSDNVYRGLALVHAALGENDRAFEMLEKSYELREESLLSLKVDPKMEPLHSDPRFSKLLMKIGVASLERPAY